MTDWAAKTSGLDHQEAKPTSAPIRIGSEAHKTLFCRTPVETSNPYRPAVIDGPNPDDGAPKQLIGLPIWGVAEPGDIYLAEHYRRLGQYEGWLLRPKTVTFMVGLARGLMRARGSTPAPV